MRLIFYLYLFSSLVNAGIYDQTESKMDKGIEELDDDITLEKKSLMILTADADDDQEIAERVLSIISTQATSIGRFEVIDRNLVDQILEEQKFQLSGMVDSDQIVEIGELAAAENALTLDIVNFGQEGVPKDDDDDSDETLFTWLVKALVKESIEARKRKDTERMRLELDNNIHTELRANIKIINVETGISENSFSLNASHTGGNRDASLEKVLAIISSQIRRKLNNYY